MPRVRLCFTAEDPSTYARRLGAAQAGLAAVDQQLAFELCVDSMPVEDVPQLTTEQVNRVLAWALNTHKLQEKLMDTSSLINEANLEHARTLNKVMLQALVAAREEAATDAAAAGQGCAAAEQLLPIKAPPSHLSKPTPGRATVQMPAGYDFCELRDEFAFKTLLTRPEVITAVSKIRLESGKVGKLRVCCAWPVCVMPCGWLSCAASSTATGQGRQRVHQRCAACRLVQVIKLCLFNTFSSKSVRLEEFEQVQFAATDSVANHLRDNWMASIRSIIK